MELLAFFSWLNNDVFALPAALLFFGVAVILTFKLRFVQFRGIARLFHMLKNGIERKERVKGGEQTIDARHALFAAMGTTIGMGNIVGPAMAIMMGGPGALFWLLLYILIGSVSKFTEVTFALNTRTSTDDGLVIGGPMRYLRSVSVFLARWYGIVMTVLFAGWNGLQANNLANIFAIEHVPNLFVGVVLAGVVLIVVWGGAQRVGQVASKLVPFMFFLYVSFALFILIKEAALFKGAVALIAHNIFTPAAAVGAFVGATIFQAFRYGTYRGIYITESGLGTSSIPHAIADTKRPSDQGILAMYSSLADLLLAALSGFLVLVTNIWTTGNVRPTLVYEVFKLYSSTLGQIVLLVSVSLFVLTTVIGNTFNGMQSFASFTKHRWMGAYIAFTLANVLIGSIMRVELAWEMMDTMLTLVAVPNLIGILILAFRQPEVLEINENR